MLVGLSRVYTTRLSRRLFAFVRGRAHLGHGSARLGECENLVESISEVPRLENSTFLHGRLYLFSVDPYFGTFEREENSARLFFFSGLDMRDGSDLRAVSHESGRKERSELDRDDRGAPPFTIYAERKLAWKTNGGTIELGKYFQEKAK